MKKKHLLLLVGLSLVVYLLIPLFMQSQPSHPLIIAHRGASAHAPENTLASVQKALDMQADLIEIDIHLSKDGEVIVIHDATLDRTTDGTGEVQAKTLAELKELDAGSWKDAAFAGEKIPTLAEVMELINGQAILLIEFKKGEKDYHAGMEKKCLELIEQYDARDWCILQSFYSHIIEEIRALDTEIEVHKLMIGNIPILPIHVDHSLRGGSVYKYQEEVQAVNPMHKFAGKRFINGAHKRGLKVFTYTVNEKEDMQKLIELGVDGIITNYPDRLKELLEGE